MKIYVSEDEIDDCQLRNAAMDRLLSLIRQRPARSLTAAEVELFYDITPVGSALRRFIVIWTEALTHPETFEEEIEIYPADFLRACCRCVKVGGTSQPRGHCIGNERRRDPGMWAQKNELLEKVCIQCMHVVIGAMKNQNWLQIAHTLVYSGSIPRRVLFPALSDRRYALHC